jgi:hypothetical protein
VAGRHPPAEQIGLPSLPLPRGQPTVIVTTSGGRRGLTEQTKVVGAALHPEADDGMRAALKQELRAAIGSANPDGTYDDPTHALIHAILDELTPLTPTPRPIDRQEFVASPWGLDYAEFGPRHTAGKPIRHLGKLSHHTFNLFPPVEILQESISQEIRVDGEHYNNIMELTTPDGSYPARRIVWGRYRIDRETPQRYEVSFDAVELLPPDGSDAAELRARFGLDPDLPLRREQKPPRLHSDVVYCDEDMRINFGVMGGIYVLHRLHTPGISVSFA